MYQTFLIKSAFSDVHSRLPLTLWSRQQYLSSNIYIAKESHMLRSIMMMVDRKENIECILDPGCQIVAMAEDICHNLGLMYDPTI